MPSSAATKHTFQVLCHTHSRRVENRTAQLWASQLVSDCGFRACMNTKATSKLQDYQATLGNLDLQVPLKTSSATPYNLPEPAGRNHARQICPMIEQSAAHRHS